MLKKKTEKNENFIRDIKKHNLKTNKTIFVAAALAIVYVSMSSISDLLNNYFYRKDMISFYTEVSLTMLSIIMLSITMGDSFIKWRKAKDDK